MNDEKSLIERLDEAAINLLDTMKVDTMTIEKTEDGEVKVLKPVEPNERVAIFNSVVRYLAVKHKVDPEGVEAGIDDFVNRLHGPQTGSKGRGSRAKGT
jgi:hypothetical protein